MMLKQIMTRCICIYSLYLYLNMSKNLLYSYIYIYNRNMAHLVYGMTKRYCLFIVVFGVPTKKYLKKAPTCVYVYVFLRH